METPRLIHVIFKTHLDIGYTDFAANVTRGYIESFIPAALERARQMRNLGEDRFVWTTGSWLIDEYLRVSPAKERKAMEKAIRAGDITWHGLPFTLHSELLDAELLRAGLRIATRLDDQFGRKTIAAKMTDVPGHTRAIVPFLAEAGIRFLHIGVNGASTAPDVPPVFRWQAPGGSEVMVMYHQGYGDLMLVPGLDEAIYFAHTNDNLGPQRVEEIQALYAGLRQRFPGAEVRGSTMDAFAASLEKVYSSLPVVEAEIGDSWNHGLGSDPWKTSRLRRLLRLRSGWLEDGRLVRDSGLEQDFHRNLLLVCEHTWGLDEKTFLGDRETYAPEAFQAVRSLPAYQKMEASWREQRNYLAGAVGVLPDALQAEAQEAIRELEVRKPDPEGEDRQGWERTDPYLPFGEGRFTFGFNGEGGLAYLFDRETRQLWASPTHALGFLRYQTFSQRDYDRFYRQYIVNKRQTAFWAVDDFTKPGIQPAGALSRMWVPKLERLYTKLEDGSQKFLLWLLFPSQAVTQFGAPAEAWLEVQIPQQHSEIRFNLQWFGKAACRFPEALWFSFEPVLQAGAWTLEKLGQAIDPLEVVWNGNRHLHGIGAGVEWRGNKGSFSISSPDTPLVAPGKSSLLNFNNRLPAGNAMHFLLYDNLWGTNFPMWFEEDMRFDFRVQFAPKPRSKTG